VVAAEMRYKAFIDRQELLWESAAPQRFSADGTPVQRGGQNEQSVRPSGPPGKPKNFVSRAGRSVLLVRRR
jgi:hypothetical protein